MADNSFGLSFAPFGNGQQGYGQSQGSAPNPVQEAIQILSLRRPTIAGAGSPIPGALLNAPGGNGLNIGALLQTLMRQYGQQGTNLYRNFNANLPKTALSGAFGAPQTSQPGYTPGYQPLPRITPAEQPGAASGGPSGPASSPMGTGMMQPPMFEPRSRLA